MVVVHSGRRAGTERSRPSPPRRAAGWRTGSAAFDRRPRARRQRRTRSELPQSTTVDEPMTMEELLNEQEHSIRALSHGDIVDGIVVRVDPDEVLVDIGSKSEGVISNRELGMRGDPNAIQLNEGDEIK